MRTVDFDYPLPPELIAQVPASERDASRLLVLDRAGRSWAHRQFRDLPSLLRPGDLLVANDSRVIPARLHGHNERTGGAFELLLLQEVESNEWWCMLRPGRRGTSGTRIRLSLRDGTPSSWTAEVRAVNPEGHRRIGFTGPGNLRDQLRELGDMPLPPYIRRVGQNHTELDLDRYQTVFARDPGSVAAPTAGLHFTPGVVAQLQARGVRTATVTLHVGPGTFAPVKTDDPAEHVMHEEPFVLPPATVAAIQETRDCGGRVVAVGTTALRVLETVAARGPLTATAGRTRLFVRPPGQFQVVNALLTNFHLPCSTLLMLVSAFAAPGATTGRDLVLAAYADAVRERYRFFSYGDAMFLA